MSGYDPERIFELIGSVGFNLAYTSNSEHKFQPGLNAGVQGVWHINDFFGLYLEPQIRLYRDKFIEGNLGFIQKDVMVGSMPVSIIVLFLIPKRPIAVCLRKMTNGISYREHWA